MKNAAAAVRVTALMVACVFASAAGCGGAPKTAQADPTTTPARSSSANTDPCAMRLHDVCGPLLLYYASNRALPAKLEQLSAVPGFDHVKDFTCPASGKPYVYNPPGIPAPDRAMRLIIYDAVPAHGGTRWAIAIPINPGEGPLVAKVVAVPESRFSPR